MVFLIWKWVEVLARLLNADANYQYLANVWHFCLIMYKSELVAS